MGGDVEEDQQTVSCVAERRRWWTPVLTEFDVVANTEITNCGSGSDGVICQGS